MDSTTEGNCSWESRFEAEMAVAENARLRGNEGMARVCARRAAGIVAGEYLRRRNIASPSTSAYVMIKTLQSMTGLPEGSREMTDYLLMRITPEHTLPVQIDLLKVARWLKQNLLCIDEAD
jgi:hypothetical protein